MELDKIIEELNSRFAAPLPEFYKRRIIVWHDEDGEFADKIDALELENAKLAVLTGSNNFAIKKLLCYDDECGNYLLYCPVATDDEDNWLLDVELYSESFRADLISIWADELELPQSPSMRKGLREYRKFFNSKERRKLIKAQGGKITVYAQLQSAIMAALAQLKNPKPAHIIKAVLSAGLNEEYNSVYQSFVNYSIDSAFWLMAEQGTGYSDTEPKLSELCTHIFITAAAHTTDFPTVFDKFISPAHEGFCYDMVSEWFKDSGEEKIYSIADHAQKSANIPQALMGMDIDAVINMEIFPCVNEIILYRLMDAINDSPALDVPLIRRAVSKRRTSPWFGEFKYYYDGLEALADMQEFYKKYSSGFHIAQPQKLWEEYTSSYYLMDSYYRHFRLAYDKSLKNYHNQLSDLFAAVAQKAEGLYSNWFLDKLADNWTKICAEDLNKFGYIPQMPQQTNFYRSKISACDTKVYVIVSDALRYDVAAELAEQLKSETQSKVTLSSMEALFPTITKFGMAALLPCGRLTAEERGDRLVLLADGQSTEANNRDKVLKSVNAKSVALKYKDIIGMKRAERQSLVKGMEVVYIYHDTIDEAGHLEKSIFAACDEAIDEIKNLVRIIVNEFGGTNIFITADHGFLYTASPLREDSKVDKSTPGENDVEIGRRYAIMRSGTRPNNLLPVKFLGGDANYEAFTPAENSRIKIKGGGLNFVHGGISLQEMVVPLINYRFLRNTYKEYTQNKDLYDTKNVTLALLSSGRKISNMTFSLNFYQTESVSPNRKASRYQLYFTDADGKQVSDLCRIIADKKSDDARERTFRGTFNLKSMKYDNTEEYYLVIADEAGNPCVREEFQIDIPFETDEFDFFS